MESTFVIGVNFKNANVEVRSAFSMGAEKQMQCNTLAKQYDFQDFVVLSTCNRTEIYGSGSFRKAENMITEICEQPVELFNQYKFVKTSEDAIRHIFNVASGLDSQILGDYEILGQFKNACRISKENGLLGPVFERMANVCIQASKEIKTKTDLSRGTVSASYAAIEVIRNRFGEASAKALLVGMGKLGNNIAKNIKHYLPNIELTISNRTYSTAAEIAESEGFSLIPYEEVVSSIKDYNIVVLCANGNDRKLMPEDLPEDKPLLILDLSVPQSIHQDCLKHAHIEILDIDTISQILNETFEKRSTYVPIAHEIIDKHMAEFLDWRVFYKKRDQIVTMKQMFIDSSHECTYLATLDEASREVLVNKAMQEFVLNLKDNQSMDPEVILGRFKEFCHRHETGMDFKLLKSKNKRK